MSIRLEMLQAAQLAPKLLQSSTPLVEEFFRRTINPDGGFANRAGRSDLYYTVFGLDGMSALKIAPPAEHVASFLRTFGDGKDLDLVHFCCLVRAWTALKSAAGKTELPPELLTEAVPRLESFRTTDGGYNPDPAEKNASAYGNFLVLSAYQDLQLALPDPVAFGASINPLQIKNGGWANDLKAHFGLTTATAAILTIERNLGRRPGFSAGDWLMRQVHPQGGFRVAEGVPVPDLLSTATALHALSGMGCDLKPVAEGCLDFLDSLWNNCGGFHGHWEDDHVDTEYTFYGLLTLGHLSLYLD